MDFARTKVPNGQEMKARIREPGQRRFCVQRRQPAGGQKPGAEQQGFLDGLAPRHRAKALRGDGFHGWFKYARVQRGLPGRDGGRANS